MRCPDCNKFASYDEPQCESSGVEVDDDSVRTSVTVQLNCQECGGTLKDTEIESGETIEHDCCSEPKPVDGYKEGEGDQYEIESEGDPEGASRVQSIDRNGKPIKSSRYMKTFYGFTLETEIKCRKCGEVFGVTLEGEEQASGFNECC